MSPLVARRIVVLTSFAALVAVAANSAYQWTRAVPFGWSGLHVRFESQFSGEPLTEETRLLVEDVQPRSPASAAGLEKREHIVGVEGSSKALVQRFAAIPPGKVIGLNVESRTVERAVLLRYVDAFSFTRVPVTVAYHVLLGLIALAIGGFVIARRPGDQRATLLFVLMSLFALVRFAEAGPVHRYGLDAAANLIQLLAAIGGMLLYFPVLLHLFLVFPSKRPVLDAYPRLTRYIYLPVVVMATVVSAFVVAGVVVAPPESRELRDFILSMRTAAHQFAIFEPWAIVAALGAVIAAWRLIRNTRGSRPGYVQWLLYTECALVFTAMIMRAARLAGAPSFLNGAAVLLLAIALTVVPAVTVLLGYPVAACIACWRNYRESEAESRRQLRWPLLGLLLAVGGYVLTTPLVRIISWLYGWDQESLFALFAWWYQENAPELAFLLIPVTIAFAILKYRLFDIDVYVRRTIIYGGLTGIIGLVFLVLTAAIGAVLAQRFASDRDWSPVAATVIAGALVLPVRTCIQNAVDSRFYRRRDYAAAIARVTSRLVSGSSYGPVVDEICEAVPARAVALWIRSLESPVCELKALSGKAPTDLPHTVPVSAAEERLRLTGEYIQQVVRAGVPYGFLVIGPKLAETAWDDRDRNFLHAVAGQIALTVSVAGDDDSDRAAEIQRALLPASIPQTCEVHISAVSQPARLVGGDYYDVMHFEDRRVALAIADVSGKGVPAALLMSNVQAALRLLAPEVASPAAVCTRLNALMCGNVSAGRFVTFFYGVLEPGGAFVYCNAGHNAPIVSRGDTELRLECGGVPLGILPGATYEESRVALHAGDRLVLFTDGVCDATNEHGHEFGDDGLLRLVRRARATDPAVIRNAIIDELTAHCGGVFSDDVTLVVACYRGTQTTDAHTRSAIA